MPEFKLNDTVKDTITGFQGVVVAITVWLNGCERLGLQSRELDNDGTPLDIIWFDEEQCELVPLVDDAQDAVPAGLALEKPGGPQPDPARASDPQ